MLLIVSLIQIIIPSDTLYAENPDNSISNSTLSLNFSKVQMISPDNIQLILNIYNLAEVYAMQFLIAMIIFDLTEKILR